MAGESQIFYSTVDQHLQEELNARALAAKSRNTSDLRFMLEKIGNVSLQAFSTANYKTPIDNSLIGGKTVLGPEYQPDRFLSTPNKRIPPVITSADLSISDNSMGLSQEATVKILIPDPLVSLDIIEVIYMRPGRPVKLIFTHPDTAVITGNRLLSTTLPILQRLQKLYPGFTESDLDEFSKMNQLVFLGLVKSFDLTYESDGSASVVLSIIGTTNVYTDLSLISNTAQTSKDPNSDSDRDINRIKSFYKTITDDIENLMTVDKDELATQYTNRKTVYANTDVYAFLKKSPTKFKTNHAYVLVGKPSKGQSEQRYVTLAYVIDQINKTILSKVTEPGIDSSGGAPSPYLPYNYIIFTEQENACISNYYEHLVSANPINMFLPDINTRTYINKNGKDDVTKIWFGKTVFNEFKFLNTTTTDKFSHPTCIFVNIELIKNITDNMVANSSYKVSDFIKTLVGEVYKCTGGAIDLNLITAPTNQTQLLLYDAKRMPSGFLKAYPIPMFANDPRGTAVQDFSFHAKLPDDISSLMAVINQGGGQLSEAILAPQLAYMYTTVDTLQGLGIAGTAEPEYEKAIAKLEEEHRKNYKINLDTLYANKNAVSDNWNEQSRIDALETALKKYIQTPTDKLRESITLAKPVIPFDVEFTIDGINGFRYGDILQFNGLPLRYRNEMVYTIISVTHTIDTSGVWTTKIRCIARTVLE